MKLDTSDTAKLLQELRESKGLSPEQVPYAMLSAKIDRDAIPSSRTIRRVEETGRKPQVRYAFGLAHFYGVDMHHLWPRESSRRRRVYA